MRKFKVIFTCEAEIELDDIVINMVDDEWRGNFYELYTPEDIAEHIAYNLIFNNARLSQLDGWASLSDENANLVSSDIEMEEVEEVERE